MTERRQEAVVDETIRLTVWANIRRYVVLGGIGFVIVDLIITLTVVVAITISTREADERRAAAACRNTAALANIQRQDVEQQRKQTDELVKDGNTFGIPKVEFEQLVKESRAREVRNQKALDKLVKEDCEHL